MSSTSLAAELRERLGPAPELAEWPLVSIVIPNRDGADHLRRLFAGLLERTDYPSVELILVDNGSSDDSLDFVRGIEAPFPISIVANHHNESFSDACNQGAELAAGELLLFLNNDIEPFEPGWLRELVACLRPSEAGLVGATLIQPDSNGSARQRHVIQQRGLFIRARDGGELATGLLDHLADPLGGTLGVDADPLAVAAACLVISRGTFAAVGGFTHGYLYGGEDVDLALKLRSAGLGVRCSGRSFLIHAPHSIRATAGAERVGEWARANRRLFLERWGPVVRREYELSRCDDAGPGRAAAEALAYCLKTGEPNRNESDAGTDELLAAVRELLISGGYRCLTLRGADVDDPRGLECDVVVHFRGASRYVPGPAQLNVLWSVDHLDDLTATECSRYDLVVCGSELQAERLRRAGLVTPVAVISAVEEVGTLAATVQARAGEIGLQTRIQGPAPAHGA